MAKYICTICEYVYDEEQEGTMFGDLAADWVCPVCGAPTEEFELLKE